MKTWHSYDCDGIRHTTVVLYDIHRLWWYKTYNNCGGTRHTTVVLYDIQRLWWYKTYDNCGGVRHMTVMVYDIQRLWWYKTYHCGGIRHTTVVVYRIPRLCKAEPLLNTLRNGICMVLNLILLQFTRLSLWWALQISRLTGFASYMRDLKDSDE